jgi:PleD family two-component response regulator
MMQPLALVLYENLLPGSQIVNRLQDLNYRVHSLNDPNPLVECAEQVKPMLVLADLEPNRAAVFSAITRLKKNPATQHLPVVGFATETDAALQGIAQTAGITVLANYAALVSHLPQFLEQALQVE